MARRPRIRLAILLQSRTPTVSSPSAKNIPSDTASTAATNEQTSLFRRARAVTSEVGTAAIPCRLRPWAETSEGIGMKRHPELNGCTSAGSNPEVEVMPEATTPPATEASRIAVASCRCGRRWEASPYPTTRRSAGRSDPRPAATAQEVTRRPVLVTSLRPSAFGVGVGGAAVGLQ